MLRVDLPGVMKLGFRRSAVKSKISKELVLSLAAPLLEGDAQITFLIDGLG